MLILAAGTVLLIFWVARLPAAKTNACRNPVAGLVAALVRQLANAYLRSGLYLAIG